MQVSGSSVLLSMTSMAPAGGIAVVGFTGIFNTTSSGTVRLQYAGVASTAASPITILAGTHMMCYRLK
jgi:hypothetical protein